MQRLFQFIVDAFQAHVFPVITSWICFNKKVLHASIGSNVFILVDGKFQIRLEFL